MEALLTTLILSRNIEHDSLMVTPIMCGLYLISFAISRTVLTATNSDPNVDDLMLA